jgi:hypothetical protein
VQRCTPPCDPCRTLLSSDRMPAPATLDCPCAVAPISRLLPLQWRPPLRATAGEYPQRLYRVAHHWGLLLRLARYATPSRSAGSLATQTTTTCTALIAPAATHRIATLTACPAANVQRTACSLPAVESNGFNACFGTELHCLVSQVLLEPAPVPSPLQASTSSPPKPFIPNGSSEEWL